MCVQVDDGACVGSPTALVNRVFPYVLGELTHYSLR